MGQQSLAVIPGLTAPNADEIEVSLAGPGYGECVLIHIGDHKWVVVDSCRDANKQPVALSYLDDLGLDPAEAVRLIVATHWHDDHIQGMADVVEACENARFCCASVLVEKEFLTLVSAFEMSQATRLSSGASELVKTHDLLQKRDSHFRRAGPDRLILSDGDCNVWSLSPTDSTFDVFLRRIGRLVRGDDGPRGRLTSLDPNDTSVVLLIEVGDSAILLGGDLEQPGWLAILESDRQITTKASVFKVPHHGSEDAYEERVWTEMLHEMPIATLTPWRRGKWYLPTEAGVERIRTFTDKVFITAPPVQSTGRPARNRDRIVTRAIQEGGINLRSIDFSRGMVRMRKRINSSEEWEVVLIGMARQLV